MTTPAQEAKDFAAKNGFTIAAKDRRYVIANGNQIIAEVGGYPAALNAMKRHVEELGNVQSDSMDTASVESVADAAATGEIAFGIPADTIVGEVPAFVLTQKLNLAGWDKVEYEKPAEVPTVVDMTFKRAVEDWNAGNVNHPFAPAAAPRTGWYVRVTGPHGFVIDIPCPNMKEAYRSCAQTANWFKRNGLTPITQRSVIFKRGA